MYSSTICIIIIITLTDSVVNAVRPTPIERIKSIERKPNLLVINTDAAGSADRLRIRIDVDPIVASPLDRWIAPIDLSGLALLATRGQYRITNLQPNRWYGISFKSEHIEKGISRSNLEYRLEKTLASDEIENDDDEPFEIDQRESIDVRQNNIVNQREMQLSAKWTNIDLLGKAPQLIVKIDLACDNQSTISEQLRIDRQQMENRMLFKIDYDYKMNKRLHITSKGENRNEVTAKLTPKKCYRICWTPWLRTTSESRKSFTKSYNRTCEDIESKEMRATIRDYIDYDVTNQSITIMTTDKPSDLSEIINDEMVTVSIYDLEKTHKNESKWIDRPFVDAKSYETSRFMVDRLNADNWYAVRYNYTRMRPFAYIECHRQVIGTMANVDDDNQLSSSPIEIIAEIRSVDSELNQIVTTYNGSTMNVWLTIGSVFIDYTIIAKATIENERCLKGLNETKIVDVEQEQFIELNQYNPKQLLNFDFQSIVCKVHKIKRYCQDESMNGDKLSTDICDTKLCIRGYLQFDGEQFEIDSKCEKLDQLFSLNQEDFAIRNGAQLIVIILSIVIAIL